MNCQHLRRVVAWGLVILATSAGASAFGQEAEVSTVNGVGSVSISRVPEIMRMQVDLSAKGATLKEALAELKTRRDAARTQIVALGADKDSIAFGPAAIAVQDPNRRNAMEMMMAQRMKRGGKGAAKSKTSAPVEVTSKLTAEWKFKTTDPEALLLDVHPLQEKIRGADLAGKEEASKLTAEQQEVLEELEANGQSSFSMNEEETPGKPEFLFVSRITEAEHTKALRTAYEKAQVQAKQLAAAAGYSLGPVRSISSYNDPSSAFDGFSMRGYGQAAYRLLQEARQRDNSEATPEAVGMTPGKVDYSIAMTVSFGIAKGN